MINQLFRELEERHQASLSFDSPLVCDVQCDEQEPLCTCTCDNVCDYCCWCNEQELEFLNRELSAIEPNNLNYRWVCNNMMMMDDSIESDRSKNYGNR